MSLSGSIGLSAEPQGIGVHATLSYTPRAKAAFDGEVTVRLLVCHF